LTSLPRSLSVFRALPLPETAKSAPPPHVIPPCPDYIKALGGSNELSAGIKRPPMDEDALNDHDMEGLERYRIGGVRRLRRR
jgi:hypothetical protein